MNRHNSTLLNIHICAPHPPRTIPWNVISLFPSYLNSQSNRVPGNFHIESRSKYHNLNPFLANVSHTVSHLSFGTCEEIKYRGQIFLFVVRHKDSLGPMNDVWVSSECRYHWTKWEQGNKKIRNRVALHYHFCRARYAVRISVWMNVIRWREMRWVMRRT